MKLPFMTHWADGTPTYFINKIWQSLLQFHYNLYVTELQNYKDAYVQKFGKDNFVSIPSDVRSIPKLTTIRKGKRWKAGDKIHFCINDRSKNYFQFAPVIPVKSVQEIEIRRQKIGVYIDALDIIVDGKTMSITKEMDIALNDGFTGGQALDKFMNFFVPKENDIFKGQIIHWTDLKY